MQHTDDYLKMSRLSRLAKTHYVVEDNPELLIFLCHSRARYMWTAAYLGVFFTFSGTSMRISVLAVLIYIPTNSIRVHLTEFSPTFAVSIDLLSFLMVRGFPVIAL